MPLVPKSPSKIELLEKQLAAEPAQVSILVALAEEYLRAGRARRAVELLENAVGQKSEDIHLHLLLGKTQEAAGDYARALDAYLTAAKQEAWDPEVEAVLFREDLLLKAYPRSVDELSKIVARRGNVQLWRLLARVSEIKGNFDKAFTCLTQAIQIKPDDVNALESLARLSEKRQEREEAKKWHQRVLEVNPESRFSHLFLAQECYAQGKYKEAISYFERLLAQERDNRFYQLSWLLANVKGYGIHGYENGIAEALQWQNLAEEENPLASELFVLAGQERLTKGDLAGAEPYLLRAHHLTPSQDVAKLLAMVEERRGEQAQRKGDLTHALLSYQQAATYDPSNETYTRKITYLVARRIEEKRRKRQARLKRGAKGISVGLAAMLLIGSGVLGYHRTVRDWLQAPSSSGEPSSSSFAETPGGSGDRKEPEDTPGVSNEKENPQVSNGGSKQIVDVTEPPMEKEPLGKVVTATEFGIHVSGKGMGDPNRSPEAIQQEVEPHFPDLQEVYEIERAADPSLMGSLVLELTIAPDGSTSQVRFKSAKIASKKLQDIVHGLAHEWRFSPAGGAVQVTYPLLFLPPGMDAASIIARERSVAAPKPGTQPTETERTPPASGGSPSKPRGNLSAAKSLELRLRQEGFRNVTVRGSGLVITLTGEVRSRKELGRVLTIARKEAKAAKHTLEWNIAVASSR